LSKVPERHPDFEPLTRWLTATTGHLPVSGDTHLCEYLPYTSRPEGWSRYAVQAYDHVWSERGRQARRGLVEALAAGSADPEALRSLPTERVEHLIAGVWHDTGAHEEAVNVVNRPTAEDARAIDNLPDDAIVEVPGTLHRDGVRAEAVGALPQPVAEWCRREATCAALAVRATLEGRRDLARQALLLDPTAPDLEEIDALLSAYLDAFSEEVGGRWA
jgi:alpha-galactosidase